MGLFCGLHEWMCINVDHNAWCMPVRRLFSSFKEVVCSRVQVQCRTPPHASKWAIASGAEHQSPIYHERLVPRTPWLQVRAQVLEGRGGWLYSGWWWLIWTAPPCRRKSSSNLNPTKGPISRTAHVFFSGPGSEINLILKMPIFLKHWKTF